CYLGTHAYRKVETIREEGVIVRLEPRPEEEWITKPVPPIIDEETFETAQRLLERNRQFSGGRPPRHYLLRGLVTCGRCGGPAVGAGRQGRGQLHYYRCSRSFHKESCGSPRVNAYKLEDAVWELAVETIRNPGLVLEALLDTHPPSREEEDTGELHAVE